MTVKELQLAYIKNKNQDAKTVMVLLFAFISVKKQIAKTVAELEFVLTTNEDNCATTQNAMAVQCSVVFQAAIKFLAKSTGATV